MDNLKLAVYDLKVFLGGMTRYDLKQGCFISEVLSKTFLLEAIDNF